ncbi:MULTISPECIES: hypothetical protein [Niallia]|uniref:hypothetical protein n=1 Tax=Niallia TaxID=2837506 RepID=UPI0011A19447|nr:hypothetical protein [Niallia circulans]MDR4316151.1 hypothetical protein [Niallia circulans]MED3837404.1 hypothetical protein [Niallia circulans]MED4244582.1 hypothetical protein [Niallia circulans]MED4249934.1 hypothetical protein [Niallia circulans]QKH60596.1 hypothetical protein FOC77_08015 [Niallia circulans]
MKNIIGDFPADKDSVITNARNVNEYSIEVRIESLLNNPECRELLQTHLPILLEVEVKKVRRIIR